jgi:glycolate oxidase FAD binding subunit
MPGTIRGTLDPWGWESNSLPLMKEIKRRFDPNRILNPGRFVGNI